MTAKEVLINLNGFVAWDIQNYPLSKNEAMIIIDALRMKVKAEEGGKSLEDKSVTDNGVDIRADDHPG